MGKIYKKYDMSLEPNVPNLFWHTFEKVVSWFMCGPLGTKTTIKRINCENLKGPYLVLSSHASFIDFPHNVLAMENEKSCWVASVEEFIGIRSWLFDKAKVIPKRKFSNDMLLVHKIVNATRRKGMSMTIYPEARFSIAGIINEILTLVSIASFFIINRKNLDNNK